MTRRRVDTQLATKRFDPVAHIQQTTAGDRTRIKTHAIVNNPENDPIPLASKRDADVGIGPRMSDRILHRFHNGEVDGELNCRIEASDSLIEDANHQRRERRSRPQSRSDALEPKHGRVYASRKIAKLGDGSD